VGATPSHKHLSSTQLSSPHLQFDVQRAELQSRLHDAWGREELLRNACHSQLQALEDKEGMMTVGGQADLSGVRGGIS